jgi:hypothetical protein
VEDLLVMVAVVAATAELADLTTLPVAVAVLEDTPATEAVAVAV